MGLSHELIRFSIRPPAPFRLDLTVWALRRRAANAVDAWDGATYRRVLAVRDKPILVAVKQRGKILDVTVTGKRLAPGTKQRVVAVLERLLGIRENLSDFYELSSLHPRLQELTVHFLGFKPPRFATVFEALVNGLTCQQLSLTVGIILLNRLTERCGLLFEPGSYAFPRPEDLASLSPADLRPLGYSGSKARALIEVSQSIVARKLDLEELAGFTNRQCVERLTRLYGVGRWTAEYVLLRGLGRVSVFPGDDVGARNSLERWLRLRTKLDYERVQKILNKWKGYGGLIFLLLLLKGLGEAGDLSAAATLDRERSSVSTMGS